MVVVGVGAETERPRFLSPVHDPRTPRRLLWMDRRAMEEKTGTVGMSPLLLTQTREEDDDDDVDGPPFRPSRESATEFKVMPATHAGYAVTWFGLSGAGMVMTRKLITRGR